MTEGDLRNGRFFAVITPSRVMLFGLFSRNKYLTGHLLWSETRAYVAVLMGVTMAIIMLFNRVSMYSNKTMNMANFAKALIVCGGSLWKVRSQVTADLHRRDMDRRF